MLIVQQFIKSLIYFHKSHIILRLAERPNSKRYKIPVRLAIGYERSHLYQTQMIDE
jgi:hypothetical protein